MTDVKAVSDFIDSIAPYGTKCEWDNCGILEGDAEGEVKKIGFALDLTEETLTEAEKNGVDLIITHHPIIFHAQKNFLKGNLVYALARKGINAISAHTCFDCAKGGVNDALCEILGLKNVELVESGECVVPMARIGEIDECSPSDFAKRVSSKLNTTVRFVNAGKSIKRVAVCGGAGMSFLDDVISCKADAYVTGDISHHEMLEAKEKGISVAAAGHFETEYPAMEYLRKRVANAFSDVETLLLKQSNPVEFIG